MKSESLPDLHKVTQARYLREFDKIRAILQEESRLRQDLAKLHQQEKMTRPSPETAHQMQIVGADMLWQGWAARTRRELNIQLAQVMARKLIAMDQIRKAFGQRQALETMMADATAQARRRQAAKFLDNMTSPR
ncbi:hypothetical protein ACXYMO_13200 [Arenibacterium sp. CAU 1754]